MTKMSEKQKSMRAKKRAKEADRPRGRPTIDPDGERMNIHHVRTTNAQWETYHKRGGVKALRAWLDDDE